MQCADLIMTFMSNSHCNIYRLDANHTKSWLGCTQYTNTTYKSITCIQVSCSTGSEIWTSSGKMWEAETLTFSHTGPRVGRGRGFVCGAHMWISEGMKDLRGAVYICVVCSGAGSMPHSRSWCNKVSCTGNTPEVGRCGRKLEEWAWMGKFGRQVHVHWGTTDHSTTHAYH